MAINIFQGGTKGSRNANTASKTSRAAAAKEALTVPSETSDSGGTAVGTSSTLSKVGNFVGKAAGIASKFLPGVGGVVAKGIANLFNDPEWWQSTPGDPATLNVPLRPVIFKEGDLSVLAVRPRAAFLEICSTDRAVAGEYVIYPATAAITQYLMPHVRKVVNATPLQTADSYKSVLQVNSTVYALWRNLKRYDYMLKHGQTYIPNTDVNAFPILQVANAAWLQSTINRLEEYLRANVRLPHTLCEYLAWRYGRIYKSNDSAKSALVLYNVLPMETSIENYNTFISELLSANSATAEHQSANADLYNTYYDHDYMVEIRDDTQFVFDKKEFCLRTNLDIRSGQSNDEPNAVYIDSSLDNPTTFMASTVSTVGSGYGTDEKSCLFPVYHCKVWYFQVPFRKTASGANLALNSSEPYAIIGTGMPATPKLAKGVINYVAGGWCYVSIVAFNGGDGTAAEYGQILTMLMACKAVDLYNKEINAMLYYSTTGEPTTAKVGYSLYDVTALSMDMSVVPDNVLANEHVYAFANLCDVDRKTSMSYRKAEKLVARDTANLIESLDVAAAK